MAWRAQMFDLPQDWGAQEAVAFYREESRLADMVLEQVPSLDLLSRGTSGRRRSAGLCST